MKIDQMSMTVFRKTNVRCHAQRLKCFLKVVPSSIVGDVVDLLSLAYYLELKTTNGT